MSSPSPTARAALVGAAAGLAIAVLNRIPAIGWIVGPQTCPGPLSWLIAAGLGALYVRYAAQTRETVTIGDGALGGAVAGAIAGAVQSFASIAFMVLFDTVAWEGETAAASAEEILGLASLYRGSGTSVILGVALGSFVSTIPGTIGGLIAAAARSRRVRRSSAEDEEE